MDHNDKPWDVGPNLFKLMKWLSVVCVAMPAFAAIIPDDRRITWEGRVGVPGGIPNRTTIFTNIETETKTSADISSAISACPSNQVVKLGAGIFTNSGMWTLPKGATLRGSGVGVTIIRMTGSGVEAAFRLGTKHDGEHTGAVRGISSGHTKGSSNIVIASSGPAVGDLMTVDQLNDTNLVELYGTFGTIDYGTRLSATRAMGQTVEVTAVDGTAITFWPPLYHTYTTGLDPEIVYWTPGAAMAGIEDFTAYGMNTGVDAVFDVKGGKYCWVKGIEVDYADRDMGRIWSSVGCEVRYSYFHDSFVHSSGQFDNPVMIAIKSSACLVEDNIFYRLHNSVMLNWGASGNVVGYNYAAAPFDSGSTNVQMYELNGNHGAHPSYNLFEGNIVGQIRDDSAWGSSSHHTYFRNWLKGYAKIFPPYTGRSTWDSNNWHLATQGLRALVLDFQQRTNNLVGNILGSTVVTNNDVRQVVSPTTRTYEGVTYLISLGYSDVSDSGTDPDGDTLPFDTLLSHVNFDTVTSTNNGVVFDSSIGDTNPPASLYLGSKPSWLYGLDWPAVNPYSVNAAIQGGSTNLAINAAYYRFLNNFSNPPNHVSVNAHGYRANVGTVRSP